MKHSRTKTRRLLLQQLFSRIYLENIDWFREAFFNWRFDYEPDFEYIVEMTDIILSHQDELLNIIEKYAPKFDIETMLKTNILSLLIAFSEMLYLTEEIPAKVSIDEAISLAKYFWDKNSQKIVNAILDSFYKNITEYQDKSKNLIHQSFPKHHFFCDDSSLQNNK